MSTLADDMINGLNLLTVKKNKLNELEKIAKTLKVLPLPIAAEIMDILVAKKIDEGNEGIYCITLSYLARLVGTFNPHNAEQRIKNMLLTGQKKEHIDRLIDMRKDNLRNTSYSFVHHAPIMIMEVNAAHYFAQLQKIQSLSERYQADYAKTRHKGKYTREYLDRIRVLLFDLRNIENQICYSLGPYAWLVRGNLFAYPDPAKKFVTIYRGKKTEHSYERDWLPL